MHLKQSFNKKSGRTYLSMVHSYRTEGKKHPTAKTIESFGYLDELKKIHDDPISHFQKVVDEYNEAEKQEAAEYIISAKRNQALAKNTCTRRNYGYIIIMKIIYELGLDSFLTNSVFAHIDCHGAAHTN